MDQFLSGKLLIFSGEKIDNIFNIDGSFIESVKKILKLLLTCCRKYEDNNLYAQITLLEFVTFLEKISQFY